MTIAQYFGVDGIKDPETGLNDVVKQNKLIVDYLERNYSLDDDIIKTIKKINKELNSQLSNIDMLVKGLSVPPVLDKLFIECTNV